MIKFPISPVQFGGIDPMKVFEIAFTILVEKGIVTDNELVGYFAKAGFVITPEPIQQSNQPPISTPAKHQNGCVCESCQRERGMQ